MTERFKCVVIEKLRETVEVRMLVQMAQQEWRLIGTLNMPRKTWTWFKPMLAAGAKMVGVVECFDESRDPHAVGERAVPSPG